MRLRSLRRRRNSGTFSSLPNLSVGRPRPAVCDGDTEGTKIEHVREKPAAMLSRGDPNPVPRAFIAGGVADSRGAITRS